MRRQVKQVLRGKMVLNSCRWLRWLRTRCMIYMALWFMSETRLIVVTIIRSARTCRMEAGTHATTRTSVASLVSQLLSTKRPTFSSTRRGVPLPRSSLKQSWSKSWRRAKSRSEKACRVNPAGQLSRKRLIKWWQWRQPWHRQISKFPKSRAAQTTQPQRVARSRPMTPLPKIVATR